MSLPDAEGPTDFYVVQFFTKQASSLVPIPASLGLKISPVLAGCTTPTHDSR